MGRNFFKDMSILEQELQNNSYERRVFQKLIDFVESGVFTKSATTLYLCSNWRLTSQEITRKWNMENCEEKSSDTWRSQISTTSRQLYKLFPDMYEAFITGETAEIQRINDTIELLSDGDESYEDIFIKELAGLQTDYSGKEYTLKECNKELEVLSRLTRKNIFDDIDNLDMDKLGYIKKVLKTPLASNRYREVNLNKVEILRQLSVLDNSRCDGVSNESTHASEGKAEDNLRYNGVSDNSVHTSDKRPAEDKKVNNYEKFGFSSMSELVGVLEEKASENPNIVRGNDIDDKGRRKMNAVKTLFTAEELRKFIASVPPEDVYTMLLDLKSK